VEIMHLAGAEDVARAASTMSGAAREMQSAANNISFAFEQHQRFMDDWLGRLETVLMSVAATP
jgi:hypothetical protein